MLINGVVLLRNKSIIQSVQGYFGLTKIWRGK